MNPGGPFLSERAKRIFEVLVEDYIATAEPVGSRIIAQKSNLHLSPATIRRIWKQHGLKPHLLRSFKLSRDPRFVDKLQDVVGLYLKVFLERIFQISIRI